eukprot:Clim_evm37s191 gene=Clim_evmTU37s191
MVAHSIEEVTQSSSRSRGKKKARIENEGLSQTQTGSLTQKQDSEKHSGKLWRIEVWNFMCHSHFTMEFGKKITFVLGPNGSGKSAIVTALQICFGARAKETARAESIRNLVKHGCRRAVVQIVIDNDGNGNPYKYHEYGDAIVVQRDISADGQGGFKIMKYERKIDEKRPENNSAPRFPIVSKSKRDLNEILDHFNIMVDNPAAVLTQEKARDFLANAGERGMYDLFGSASLLDLLMEKLTNIDACTQRLEAKLQDRDGRLQNMRELVREEERKVEKIESVARNRTRLGDLQLELAWSELMKYVKRCRELRSRQEKGENEQMNANEEVNRLVAEISEFEDQMNSERQQAQYLAEQEEQHQQELRQVKQEARLAARKKQQEEETLNDLQHNHDIVLREVESRQQSIAQNSGNQQRATAEENLRDVRTQLASVEDIVNQLELDRQRCEEKARAYSDSFRDANDKLRELRALKETLVKDLKVRKQSQRNTLLRFGQHTEKILAEIDRQKNAFSRSPVGPIGRHFEIQEPEYAKAFHHAHPVLPSHYIVNSSKDAKVLDQIFKKLKLDPSERPRVLSRPFESVKDPSSKITRVQGYKPMLDLLDFKCDVFEKRLILTVFIDNTPLASAFAIPERTAAQEFVDRHRSKRLIAFLHTGDQVQAAQYMSYQHSGSLPACWAGTGAGSLEELQGEVAQAEENVKEQERITQSSRSQKEQAEGEMVELDRKYDEEQKRRRDLSAEVQQLQDFLMTGIDSANAEEEENLRVAQRRLENLHSRIDEARVHLREARRKTEEATQRVQQTVNSAPDISDQRQSIHERMTDLKNRIKAKKTEHAAELKKVDEIGSVLDEHRKKLERATQKAEQATEKLHREFKDPGEEPSTVRDPDMVRTDIQNIVDDLEHAPSADEINDILQTYDTMKHEYEDMNSIYTKLRNLHGVLPDMYEKRKQKFHSIANVARDRIDQLFQQSASQANYVAKLRINAAERTIKILMQNGQDNAFREVSQLSGGEKSMATVSFVVSLWSTQETPFHILDEFDVFMDTINRIKALNILVRAAERRDHRQFIIITPQDIRGINADNMDNVRVQNMPMPQRGVDQSV